MPTRAHERALALAILFVCAVSSVAQTRVAATSETAGANLPAQRIGANDLVAVSVYDAPELTRTVRVGADGFVRLPMLKQRVKAEGLMPGELETAIAAALQSEQLIVDPVCDGDGSRIQQPSHLGGRRRQAAAHFPGYRPGYFARSHHARGRLEPGSRARDSGHPRPSRRERCSGTPWCSAYLVKGLIDAADPALNIKLNGGEEIRVPESGKVYVIGNVKTPGAFPVGDGTESTVLKMLALSQGLMPYASKEAYIYRREGNGNKNEIPIPLDKIMERKAPDVPLVANDILYVPDNKGRRLTLGALEKILIFGSGAAAAAIYTLR